MLATGLPSYLTRIIDIVTIAGHGLMVVIHIRTDEEGRLVWEMLDAVDVGAAAESPLASGSSFRFHSAERLVPLVHSVELQFSIAPEVREHRVVLTVADQAMAGPGSIRFVEHEAVVDKLKHDPLKEGICAFHVVDCAGAMSDRAFPEVVCQDRFLRLLRHHFHWGTGRIILRSIASEWAKRARHLVSEAATLLEKAVTAELNRRPVAATGFRFKAAKLQEEASKMKLLGWTQWKSP